MGEVLNFAMPTKQVTVPATLGGRIGGELHQGRWYEERMLSYIASLGIAGTYLDVGANVGNHSVFFALNTRAEKVIAVEPTSKAIRLMGEFLAANDLTEKVEILPYAASDENAPVEVHSVVGAAPVLLEGRRLDDLIACPITLMKIDIEGAEPAALRGAERILRESRPRLFAEAHGEKERSAIRAVIEPIGYRETGRYFAVGKLRNLSPTYEYVA